MPLLGELRHAAVGDGVVVEGDGEFRIELLGALVFGCGGGVVAVEIVQIPDVDVRAGAVVNLDRAAIVNLRLLLVSFLLFEIAEEELHDVVIGKDRRQLLHARQRFRLVALFARCDGGEDDRAVDARNFGSDAIGDDRQRPEDEGEENDQHALESVRVSEEDDEPVEDQPEWSEPDENRQKQQRESEDAH